VQGLKELRHASSVAASRGMTVRELLGIQKADVDEENAEVEAKTEEKQEVEHGAA
jgi:hypothetical protein